MVGVEATDFREIGRHDRSAHRQILVQLGRIDVGGVLAEPVGHESDIERFDVARHVRVWLLAQQMDVRKRAQGRHVGLLGPDEHDRRLRHALGHLAQQLAIHPLMQPADITHDGPGNRRDVGRQRVV